MIATETKYRPETKCKTCNLTTRANSGVCQVCRGIDPLDLIPTNRPSPEEMTQFYRWVTSKSKELPGGVRSLEELGYPTTKAEYRDWKQEHGHEEVIGEDVWPDEDECDDDGDDVLPPSMRLHSPTRGEYGVRDLRHKRTTPDHSIVPHQPATGLGSIECAGAAEERRIGVAVAEGPGSTQGTYRQLDLFQLGEC